MKFTSAHFLLAVVMWLPVACTASSEPRSDTPDDEDAASDNLGGARGGNGPGGQLGASAGSGGQKMEGSLVDAAATVTFGRADTNGPVDVRGDDAAASNIKPSVSVLIVGNSQTNNDLVGVLTKIASSKPTPLPKLNVEGSITYGTGLIGYWNRGDGVGTPRAAIVSKKWDFVVLQEAYDPTPENIRMYGTLFHNLIAKNGSQTVMFATATINDLYPAGFKKLNDLNQGLAKEWKAPFAPAGYSWLTFWGPNPSEATRLLLYASDKIHPGVRGTYLYACVLYSTITTLSPVGASFVPDGMEKAEALALQKAAWTTYMATLQFN